MPPELEQTTELNDQTQETVKPENSSSEVRNPEKLLELYNQLKSETKDLRAFKASKETEASQLEQDRLKKEQQYEALIPVKVKEAVEPLQKQLTKLEKEKADLLEKLGSSTKQFEELQTTLKTDKLKDQVYQGFLEKGGDKDTSKDAFWKLYGSDVTVDDQGSAKDLDTLFDSLKKDKFGAKLFVANIPEGSGTPQQKNDNPVSTSAKKPQVVTKAMLLSASQMRKHGITPEKIQSGEIVVED